VRYRWIDPFTGIDVIKQQLDDIIGGYGDLHRLSRSAIAAKRQVSRQAQLATALHRRAVVPVPVNRLYRQ
jgi:hypothetical protein